MFPRSDQRLKVGRSSLNLSNLPFQGVQLIITEKGLSNGLKTKVQHPRRVCRMRISKINLYRRGSFQEGSQMDIPLDWSNMPEEILELIFKCTDDPIDLLHCQGVCHSWYFVARHVSHKKLPSLPPLIIFTENRRTNNENNSSNNSSASEREMVFYNCHSRKFRRFPIPLDLHGSWFSGGSHGWLISTQRNKPYKISLLNAFSRAQIRLPFVANTIRDTHKLRLIMSGNPASDPNCSFLVISPHKHVIMIYKLGDRSWSKVSAYNISSYTAATFYEGHFYVYLRNGVILMIDVKTRNVSKLCTETEDILQRMEDLRDDYLIESTGELLHIIKVYDRRTRETKIKVHKLNKERKIWLKVEDLGNRALFVGYNNSVTILVPNRDGERNDRGFERSGACRANCIYFLDDSDYYNEDMICADAARRGVYDMNIQEFKGWIMGLRPICFNAPLSWIRPEI